MRATETTEFSTVPDAFRAIARLHADRVAFEDRTRAVTYGQLDEWTNRIAHALLGLGDDRPLVMVAPVRTTSLAIMLGALKAGRLCAPLDPRWPPDQWLEVTRRTGGRLLVPDQETRALVGDRARDRVLLPDDLLDDDITDPDLAHDPAAPVFLFFTSGSTGAPKGTLVGNSMLMTAPRLVEPQLGDRRAALIAPLSFITGTLTVISALLTASSGHLFDATAEDLASLPAWLDEQRITAMSLSVTLLAVIAKAANDEHRPLEAMRLVGHGGEAAGAQHFTECHRAFPNATFRHGFGMTEIGSATALFFDRTVEFATDRPVPAGVPWPWIELTIVDDTGAPVPNGEPGEIWVTSDAVALGYFDEPALTTERFLFRSDGRRTVRTGDRGRIRPDGMLEHLGRLDRQIKVHGQLVDLSLVEREVKELPQVRDAVVSAVPTDDGAHRVVAHLVIEATEPVTVGQLRRALGGRLPPYAIPSAFFHVDDIPQTITGKVDRVWLRESAVGALPLETEYVAPRNARERAVAHLFAEILAVERIGVHDDFFELGGDSLSVIDLLAGLAEELHLDLSVSDLLRSATVEAIARLLPGDAARARQVVRINGGTGRPLFCVPGIADTPIRYRPLGRRLPDTAVYAFTYRGMDARAIPDQSVAAIARRNVAAMREIDRTGPYRVLGYSFGGAVALEMAHQLTAAGHHVELLALLEPSLTEEAGSRLGQSRDFVQRAHDRTVSASPGRDARAQLQRARQLATLAKSYASRQLYLASAGIVRRRGLDQYDAFSQLHNRLLRAHAASPHHGTTVLFASQQFVARHQDALDHLLPPESAGGVRRDVAVPGEHFDLVREPNVAEVARTLDLLLATDIGEAPR
ncbi:MAG TPA: alpha/beta fold hydrolase [Acidimicrobiia bacterium]